MWYILHSRMSHRVVVYRGQKNQLYKHYWDTTKWSLYFIERWSLDTSGTIYNKSQLTMFVIPS